MGDFVHLHLHSEYSLLDGACRISDIPKAAKKAGHNAVAITDHGAMYGVVAFYNACKKEGIKPIIGCEVYVAERSLLQKDKNLDSENNHLVLLVKNKTGWENLIYMVSKAFTEGLYYKPRIDLDLLEEHSEGLICLSACLAGYIPRRIVEGKYEEAESYALRLDKLFGRGNFFLELQDHGLADDRVVCEGIKRIHSNTGIPMAATNDCHYINKYDAQNQAVLLCIQTNNVISDGRPIGFETDEFYYKSTEEMEKMFSGYEDACANTQKIADMCDFDFEFGNTKLPRYKPENGQAPDDYLRALAYDGLNAKISDGHIILDEKYNLEMYKERIDYELSVISKMGYSEYYLIVWDFVHYSKSVGIPVGPGRGSGAGSIVAFLIGITDIDPLRFDLLFERFLNPERVSMPDFDIDFCYDRRDEAIQYVRRKYGDERTSQIITFGTLAARAVVRDVGRALGMSYGEVDEVVRLIPRELGITLDKALEIKEFKDKYESSAEIRKLIDISKALEGMPRHSSIHAAGVVITEHPVTTYVPIALSNGVPVTQFDMDTIAKLGLLKFDFLALRYLTIISNSEKQIKEKNPDFDISKIDMKDTETFDMLCAGKGDGVFQLESTGMKQMLQRMLPRSLDDVIASIALYRPGPMDSIPKYIEARHDPSKIKYCSPKLAPILDVTYGCIVYQEQVMQIFREIAGYSFGHADVVRRAISKKHMEDLEAERNAFVDGARTNGVNEEDAEKLFDDIVGFANYAFNKSHAAAYGVLAYRTAYLKRHYPLQYESALLTSVITSTDKIIDYISDCRKQGITVLPPDINSSYNEFHVENDAIRFGLSAIKGIGSALVNTITEERSRGGKYADIDDFCDRLVPDVINKRQLETLIKSGALDSLGTPRRRLLAVYEKLYDGRKSTDGVGEGQIGLFDSPASSAQKPKPDRIEFPNLPEFTAREKLYLEKESCGMYFSGHILDDYSIHIDRISPDSVSDIKASFDTGDENEENADDSSAINGSKQYSDKDKVLVAGIISKRVIKNTRKGDQMAFITLEDRTSSVEILVFPKILQQYGYLLTSDTAVFIPGTVSAKDDEVKILADNVYPLVSNADSHINLPQLENDPRKQNAVQKKNDPAPAPTKEMKKLFIRVESESSPEYLRAKAFCEIFTGGVPLSFYFSDTKQYSTPTGVNANSFVIEELYEIAGKENVVIK